jgi:DNA-binding GntR family transcriptional regulator
VKAQLDRVRHLSLEDRDWLTMIFHQHEDVVTHIAAHDGNAAARAMQLHLRTVFAAIDRIAARHAEFFEHRRETI